MSVVTIDISESTAMLTGVLAVIIGIVSTVYITVAVEDPEDTLRANEAISLQKEMSALVENGANPLEVGCMYKTVTSDICSTLIKDRLIENLSNKLSDIAEVNKMSDTTDPNTDKE